MRAIPSDHDAERAVLAAILLDPDVIGRVSLRTDAFHVGAHRVLFATMLELAARSEKITLLTLKAELEPRGDFVQLLAGLDEQGVTAAHVEAHAELLRRKATARAVIHTCEQLASRGYEGGDVEELVADAEREILAISGGAARQGFRPFDQAVASALAYAESFRHGGIAGARTGFHDLDRLTGGFGPGQLIVLASRPGGGKTSLALSIAAQHALHHRGTVAFFSLEMQERELVLRLLLADARIDSTRLRQGVLNNAEYSTLNEAASRLARARVFIDETMAVTVSELAAKARRLHREAPLTLVVLDYLQLLQGRQGAERREQQIAEASRSLKVLAKELAVPVLCLSQMNRAVESRPDHRPVLSDLRESGAIEQDADLVAFIHRDQDDDSGQALLIVAKHRNGPTADLRLHFDRVCGAYRDSSVRSAPTQPELGFEALSEELPWQQR